MILNQSNGEKCAAPSGSMPVALSLFGLIALAFLAHLSFFAIGVGSTNIESFYLDADAGSSIYGSLQMLLRTIFGDSHVAGRVLSVVCAVIGVIALARLCALWAGDVIVGAVMPLGLIIFPQAAFTFALATPHALLMLLTVFGLAAATRVSDGNQYVAPMQVGSVSVLLMFLEPTGLGLAVAVVAFAGLDRRDRTFLIILLATMVAFGLLLSLRFPFPQRTSLPGGLDMTQVLTLQDGLGRMFAMLWVALAFSAAALMFSATLRDRIGGRAVGRTVATGLSFAISTLWLVFGIEPRPSDLPVYFTAVLVLGVVSALPLVLWIRLVMPKIQSVWIWILLPVVMYSCFWVVLGPINLDAFPYDQIESLP